MKLTSRYASRIGRRNITELWILTHPDLKHTAKIKACIDFLFERLPE